jgi:hypothetical protein
MFRGPDARPVSCHANEITHARRYGQSLLSEECAGFLGRSFEDHVSFMESHEAIDLSIIIFIDLEDDPFGERLPMEMARVPYGQGKNMKVILIRHALDHVIFESDPVIRPMKAPKLCLFDE